MERDMVKRYVVAFFITGLVLPVAAELPLPSDVNKFIEKREGCDHIRGEIPEPSQKQRMREVNRENGKLCKGTDKALAQLKKKYAKNPQVLQRLDEFEPDIEQGPTEAHSVN